MTYTSRCIHYFYILKKLGYIHVIFLRFGDMTARTCLSKWLQPHFNKYPNFGAASKSLAAFFKVDSSIGQMRMMAVQKQTELMKKSKPQVKRTHGSSDGSEDEKPKMEVLTDIYNLGSCKQTAKEEVASSIFAQSSQGISFSSQSSHDSEGNAGKVNIVNINQKKKKIKLSANKCTDFSSNETKQESEIECKRASSSKNEAQNMALVYTKRLQACFGKGKAWDLFKSCFRKYKELKKFEELVPVLNEIVQKQDEEDTLLEDFKCFVVAKDLSEFHLFCNVTAPQLLLHKK